MKNFKIAVATAALALASGYAVASNTASQTISANYSLAKALSITFVSNITMPALVVGTASHTVTLNSNGTATYTPSSGNPFGTSTPSNGGVGSLGEITVMGQPNYWFYVSEDNVAAASTTASLSNITFSDDSSTTGTSFQLSGGSTTLEIGAKLTIPAGYSSTSATTPFSFDVTVIYAGV